MELAINDVNEDENITDLIEYFALKNMQVKKVVAFEVYGLIVSDDKLGESEEKVLNEIENKSGIDADTFKEIEDVVEELQKIYDKVFEVLA